MTTRKTGTAAKKATAKTAAKSTASKSTAIPPARSTGRSLSGSAARTAKKAAAPSTSTKQRSRTAIIKHKSMPGDARIKSPYEVRVGGTVVPVVPFRTEALIQHVGSVTEVAELMGVAKSQPTRWRKGEAVPSPEKARLLNDLEHVYSRAAMIFEGEAMRHWMTGPNRYLGGRPIDVLRDRGASEVLDALDVAEQIAFGG